MNRRELLHRVALGFSVLLLPRIAFAQEGNKLNPADIDWKKQSEDFWRKRLSEPAFKVLRKEDTERAFTGEFWNTKDRGIYSCAGCGLDLFSSEHKFDSGTGWPSFYQPIKADVVAERVDKKFFMVRREFHCARCEGHMGHVFDDGPKPTGLRYCTNSLSLAFRKS